MLLCSATKFTCSTQVKLSKATAFTEPKLGNQTFHKSTLLAPQANSTKNANARLQPRGTYQKSVLTDNALLLANVSNGLSANAAQFTQDCNNIVSTLQSCFVPQSRACLAWSHKRLEPNKMQNKQKMRTSEMKNCT